MRWRMAARSEDGPGNPEAGTRRKVGPTLVAAMLIVAAGAYFPDRIAGQVPCAPDPDGRVYQPRPRGSDAPTRCEGFVRFVDVVGEETRLASLSFGSSSFEAPSRDTVWIGWARPDSARPVHVRASGVPGTSAEGYRMDAVDRGTADRFGWSPEFLDTQMLRADDISLLGWVEAVREGIMQQVYVPLDVYQGEPPEVRAVVAGVWTNTTLREAGLTLVGDENEYSATLRSGALLAGDVIEFELPSVPAGYYRAEFAGKTRSGVSVSAEFWLLLREP